MASLKQLAAMLRRAGEYARRVIKDFESPQGRWGHREPVTEPVVAQRGRPRFRSPGRPGMRYFSGVAAVRAGATALAAPALHFTASRTLARTIFDRIAPLAPAAPASRMHLHAVFMRPQVRAGPRPCTVIQRGFSSFARWPQQLPQQLRFPSVANVGGAARGSVLQFDLTPRVLLQSRSLSMETARAMAESIDAQISHLRAVSRELMAVARLGELPVDLSGQHIRVQFENRAEDELETLVRDVGVSRATVHPVAGAAPAIYSESWDSDAMTSDSFSDSFVSVRSLSETGSVLSARVSDSEPALSASSTLSTVSDASTLSSGWVL